MVPGPPAARLPLELSQRAALTSWLDEFTNPLGIALTDCAALVVGEVGSGREALARHIHERYPEQAAALIERWMPETERYSNA